jgi:hypothetical protein
VTGFAGRSPGTRLRILVAIGVGLAAGMLLAANASRVPGYVAAYHAVAAALVCGAVVFTGLGLSISRRTRPIAAPVLLAGVAFYAAFAGAMILLRRSGAWPERMISMGLPTRSDLIVVFWLDADHREVQRFVEIELSVPAADGGHWPRAGIEGIVRVRAGDREGYSVTFRPEATEAQRADVRRRAEGSSLVARVFENARWEEVRRAAGSRGEPPR